ncbi:MAG: NADPH-dependent FMN reductase [Spirochaetes bacterium RBG_16_49_21]|nr:MAG: NADPH-dependent FMN reductase [Spirochaetes bacterium RBG_16_49_21]
MNVLGIYGSPRKGGNSDTILDRVLDGAASAGAVASRIYVRDLNFKGCVECGGCRDTGRCVTPDDMQSVYPKLIDSHIIFLSSPVFFYGMSSQLKAFIDRCQALWSRRMIMKSAEERKRHEGGRGYLVMVGATKGVNLFTGGELTAKYFFDSLDKSYEGGIFFKAEGRGDVLNNPGDLKRAYEFGVQAVKSGDHAQAGYNRRVTRE